MPNANVWELKHSLPMAFLPSPVGENAIRAAQGLCGRHPNWLEQVFACLHWASLASEGGALLFPVLIGALLHFSYVTHIFGV